MVLLECCPQDLTMQPLGWARPGPLLVCVLAWWAAQVRRALQHV